MGARLEDAAAAVEGLMTAEFVRVARPARLRAASLPRPVAAALQRAALAAAAAVAAARRADAGLDDEAPSAAMRRDASAADLRAGDDAPPAGEDDDDDALPSSPACGEEEVVLADVLHPVAVGLLRLGRLSAALRAHRDALQLEVRACVKEVLNAALAQIAAAAGDAAASAGGDGSGSAVASREAERERSLGDRLRALPVDAYVALLEGVAAALAGIVSRAVAVHALVQALLSAPEASTPRSRHAASLLGNGAAGEEALRESGDALAATCDAAAQRWVKLLLVRTPVHARLKVAQFARVAATSNAFADALEAAAPRKCTALRATIASQAKALLAAMHTSALAKLGGALDAEAWVRCDVPAEFQACADAVVAAGTGLPAAPPPPAPSGSAPPAHAVAVGGARYTVVASALVLLRTLSQYCEVAAALPALGSDVLHRAAEALKLFNSRSCQLVLGAGALQVAGLKSITAKHLALASQSLALAGALLPHLRSALGRAVPRARHALLLTQLDRVDGDLRIHRTELHAKLVAIARDRLAAHARRLPEAAAAWGAASPLPPRAALPPPSELATQVEHELGVLRRVLEPLLLPGESASLFARVAAAFDRQLSEGLARAAAMGGAAPAHAAADAAALAAALRALPAAEGGAEAAPSLAAFVAASHASRLAAAGADTTHHAADATAADRDAPACDDDAPSGTAVSDAAAPAAAASDAATADEPAAHVEADTGASQGVTEEDETVRAAAEHTVAALEAELPAEVAGAEADETASAA
jgi:vacuolar protein sorting-associated protein 54